ncbi:MAG: hypothetical protein ACLQVF_16605, partial [Isosphaeraceae bacterium]
GIVGLLAGQGLDLASTNPCPKEDDICLSHFSETTYEFPSAIRVRNLFGHDAVNRFLTPFSEPFCDPARTGPLLTSPRLPLKMHFGGRRRFFRDHAQGEFGAHQ